MKQQRRKKERNEMNTRTRKIKEHKNIRVKNINKLGKLKSYFAHAVCIELTT